MFQVKKIHLFRKEKPRTIKNKNNTNINKNNIIIIKNMPIKEFLENKLYLEELKDDADLLERYLEKLDYKNITDNYPYFYYIISSDNIYDNIQNNSISVIIDFYQQNIDKIFLTSQSNCSLFLLKNIINSKLNSILNVNQLKLICIDITQINSEINTKNISKNNNNIFSDRKTMHDIINFFYPQNEINFI